MKKFLFLSLVFCFQGFFSQVTMSGNKIMKDGQTYKMSQYNDVFKNEEALKSFKKSRTNSTLGSIFAGVGGGSIGFGLARVLSGGDRTITTNSGSQKIKQNNSGAWAAVGIGAGLVAIGIPFAIAAKKNAEKAINLENEGSTAFQPYFKIETMGNNFALSYNF